MLQIITGRSGSGKTELIYKKIYNEAENGSLILLVPEQSSFQCEKRILSDLGAKKASNVMVLSFKRLYNAVTVKYGGMGSKQIDDGAKAVIMSMAAEEVSDKLLLYGNRSKRSDFAELMLGAVNEYKMCGVTPEDVFSAALKIKSTRLHRKLTESALVYSAYNTLLGTAYADPDDDMTRLDEMLYKHLFFKGKTVYIDSFNGFSGQEMKIVEHIIKQSDNVYISLCCDNRSTSELYNSIFRESETTLRQLRAAAQKCGVSELPVIRLDTQQRYKSLSIAAIEESVFRFDGDCYELSDGSVQLYEAADEYDEIQQTARDISRLVNEEDYTYSEISVICRRPEMYRNIIAAEFPKFGIPYFMSNPQPLEDKPLVCLVLSAFDIVHSSFNTENILAFLKTGLTPLEPDDVFILENYAYMWDIKGRRWKQPFTMNPDGNTDSVDEEELNYIEKLRLTVIKPLEEFAQSISDAENGGEISRAVYMLLNKLNTAERMKGLVDSFGELLDLKQKETEARIWDIVMNILDKMYTILKGTAVDSRRYCELLRMMIAKNPISDIPQTLDQVIVGTAGNLRSEAQKAVFIIGAHDGVFPAVPVASGLFSDSERTALIEIDLPLYDSIYGMSLKEKFNVYSALSLPSEKLFISRHTSNSKGERCEPSVIFKEITAILGKTQTRRRSSLLVTELFYTEEQAFEECAAMWNDNTTLSDSLKEYFSRSAEYADKYSAVKRAVNEEPYKLSDSLHSKSIFGNSLTLSASQTEVYHQCPFKYFCRYGLKALPRKRAAMDSGMYGSAVHYILEKLLCEEGIESLKNTDELKLFELIKKYTELYIAEIGGSADRTERFMAQFDIIEKNLSILIKRLIAEFTAGSFVPSDFELEISNDGNIPAYELELPNGERAAVVGKVDRVDTFIHNGEKYIRIVDYKTGIKKFRLSDILYGLNIQMLLYLAAIEKNGKDYYSENKYTLAPAGILYMPSTPDSSTGEYSTEEMKKAAMQKRQSAFRMNGLLIDDLDILNAMEDGIKGIYIPAKVTSGGGIEKTGRSVVSAEAYGKIFSYIDHKLIKMAQAIFDGKIERNPLKGSVDACKFCDYKTVCGYEEGKTARHISDLSLDNALKIISEEEGEYDE